MLSSKSNSKKLFLTKNKTVSSESSMKRYKSQDVYLVAKTKSAASKTATGQKDNPPTVKLSTVPEVGKPSTKINSYLQNKPKVTQKINAVSRIMNDESIQELDTQENGKNIVTCS